MNEQDGMSRTQLAQYVFTRIIDAEAGDLQKVHPGAVAKMSVIFADAMVNALKADTNHEPTILMPPATPVRRPPNA